MYSQKNVQSMVIDTTNTYTELCDLGRLTNADKSPYGDVNLGMHRHPYTGVYAMLFAPLKNKEINFVEIGIAGGASAIMWWNYFSKASLNFFDRDENFVANLCKMKFPARMPYASLMDVAVDGNIRDTLKKTGKMFDVILDDSSHVYEHQIRIVKESFEFVKPGGYLIIEDIYRNVSEKKYEEDLKEIIDMCSMTYFVICNHDERYSPGWNNDKMFVMVKK
jgi:predicted O-methyltransferase YrrM